MVWHLRFGKVRCGVAGFGMARFGLVWLGQAWHGLVRPKGKIRKLIKLTTNNTPLACWKGLTQPNELAQFF